MRGVSLVGVSQSEVGINSNSNSNPIQKKNQQGSCSIYPFAPPPPPKLTAAKEGQRQLAPHRDR